MARRVILVALAALALAACEPPADGGPDAALATAEGELVIACGGPKALLCPDGSFCQARAGACDTTTAYGTCVTPAKCEPVVEPVCGCDGKTYDNTCLRQAAGVSEASPGPCPGACGPGEPCLKGELCDPASCGSENGSCAAIPASCPRTWAPVCGCDGKTYANDCKRLQAGVGHAQDGVCPPPCGGPEATPCDEGFVCERPVGVCDEAAPGVCTLAPRKCPEGGTPVCGCDGTTWPNACAALAAGVGTVPPGEEACNGKDDDCDGQVDEGNPGGGVACTTGHPGVCSAGTTTCTDGALSCKASVLPGAQQETCNGADDDCDGQVDEGNPGGGVFCATNLLGNCGLGTTACTDGQLSCKPVVTPGSQPELCDGGDNDCDGQVDEGNPGGGVACTTGHPGVCSAGTTVCSDGALSCKASVLPGAQEETCNGKDDDCDGQVDEGNPGGGVSCTTAFPGVCSAGTTVCSDGALSCKASVLPGAQEETCNGKDDDCDGQVDEGCPVTVTYAADVQPIFQARCSPCHAGGGSGGHNMATSYADTQKASYYCAGKTKGECALVRIKDGSMPLGKGCTGDPAKDAGKAGCVTASEQATIEAWIKGGMLP